MNDNEMAVAIFGMLMSGIVLSLLSWHFGRAWAERIRNPGRTDAIKALRDEVTAELHLLRGEVLAPPGGR